MRRIALVDVNNFYVSCERLFAPHLEGKAVVVLNFPNNHLSYAITWYALAAMVLVGVFIFVREEKRSRRKG